MSHECEFCGKTFTTGYNLDKHVKTARYCLEKRGVEIVAIKCDYCNYSTTQKSTMKTHLKSCIEKRKRDEEHQTIVYDTQMSELKNRLDEKDAQLDEKEAQLKKRETSLLRQIREQNIKIAKQTKKIRKLELSLAREEGRFEGYDKGIDKGLDKRGDINNTLKISSKLAKIPIEHISPLTPDYMASYISDNFTEDVIMSNDSLIRFLTGMVTMPVEGSLERNFACTDMSRGKCHKLEDTREWIMSHSRHILDEALDLLREHADNVHRKLIEKEQNSKSHEDKDAFFVKRVELRPLIYGITDGQGSAARNKLTSSLKPTFLEQISV